MRNPELFWNADTMARACDVDRVCLIKLVRLEILPMPIMLKDEPVWRAADVRAWVKTLGVTDPAEATAALWTRWQHEEAEACGVQCGGIENGLR